MRSERVRERDALRFAAGERARLAVEREITETHIIDEADPRTQLVEDMVCDGLLKRRERESVQPGSEIGGGQRCNVGNRFAGHAHRERFWFEPRTTASRARLCKLVLPQENPDVLFVALFFQPHEEGEDPEVAAALVVEQEVTLARRDVVPRRVKVDAAGARRLTQQAPASLVAGFGPGIQRAIGEGAAWG